MELRPYQEEAVESVFNEWNEGRKKTLLVMATGTGKTICFSSVIDREIKDGKKILVLAHRGELLEQAQDKLLKNGIESCLEKAESTVLGKGLLDSPNVVVGSVQSMSGKRLEKFPRDMFDTIVVDEAHHCVSKTYQKILEYFSNAKVLGVTATPSRGDQKNLATFFESTAYEYSLLDGINDNYLSDIEIQRIPLKLDITQVSINAGDFSSGEVATAIDPYLEEIGDKIIEYCKGRKTVVFTPLIKTSVRLKGILEKKGIKTAEVNGKSEDRKVVLEEFEKGKYDVMLNSMLLTEGWDCPSVDCIIVLRPTRSFGLYMQMVGRGTRLFEGKKNLLLLDFMWLSKKHDIMNPVKMIAPSEEIEKLMSDNAFDGNKVNLVDCMNKAEADLEESMMRRLRENKRNEFERISSIQFLASLGHFNNLFKEDIYEWEKEKPTKKQLDFIKNKGLEVEGIYSKGLAKRIIDTIMFRIKKNKSSIKQIKCLSKYHFKNVQDWSFEEASKMITRIQKNRWKVPKGINPFTYNSLTK